MKKRYQSEVEAGGIAWHVEATAEDGRITAEVVGVSKSDGTLGLEVRIDDGEAHLKMLEGIVAELLTSLLGATPSEATGPSRLAAMRQELPRAYLPWTEEDEKVLLERWDGGATVATIAEELGRGTGGVRSRLVRLGRIEQAG